MSPLKKFLDDNRMTEAFVKSAQAEFDNLAKKATMSKLEKTKRVAYLKGVLHDIFLENR